MPVYLADMGGSLARTRVLVIGMMDSIHLANWLQHFSSQPVDFQIIPSSPMRRVHPLIRQLAKSNSTATYSWNPWLVFAAIPIWILDRILDRRIMGRVVRAKTDIFNPNFVHALEIQGAGYIARRAFHNKLPTKSVLVVTNYGSDIFWFGRQDRHMTRIVELLSITSKYAAECNRDVVLAKSLGFEGEVMAVQPNAGGFSEAWLTRELVVTAKRKLIMLKGYHGWVGRAHIALQAIESISTELQDYEIVVYSCNWSTKWLATRMAKRTGLQVTAYSKGALSHDEMIEKFSQTLIYVGLSLSDGISTSMLEAMAMGAIPVQTSTACCDEWFSDTGVAIHKLDAEEVAQGIQRAIGLALTTNSAGKNRETIRARASREEIAKQALAFYQP